MSARTWRAISKVLPCVDYKHRWTFAARRYQPIVLFTCTVEIVLKCDAQKAKVRTRLGLAGVPAVAGVEEKVNDE